MGIPTAVSLFPAAGAGTAIPAAFAAVGAADAPGPLLLRPQNIAGGTAQDQQHGADEQIVDEIHFTPTFRPARTQSPVRTAANAATNTSPPANPVPRLPVVTRVPT